VETIVLLHHLKHPQVDLTRIIRGDFYSIFHLLNISIPIALSLLVALLSLGVRARQIGRRKRIFRGAGVGVVRRLLQALCLIFSLSLFSAAQTNSSAPTVQFVTVDQDVKLEVLDWGGTGRPLIFLAGLGNDAHVFDKFATKFTANNHVYGITRRGFGASSKPAPANGNYAADRLGDDVIVVLNTLKLDHPVLAGHSLAGEELSSIGSRHPERVAGLIYLDAGYGYAFYDRAHGDGIFDFFQLQKRLDDFMSGSVRDDHQFMDDFSTNISRLDKELQEFQKRNASMPVLHAPHTQIPPIIKAINLGGQEYTDIRVPILAIFACPHNLDFDPSLRDDPKAKATALADNLFYTSRQADAFAAGLPSARVVRLANADHYVFRSNETDVIREMNAFLTKLP
jgi:pimeloyl-ACP methyl ester carboxylesterase